MDNSRILQGLGILALFFNRKDLTKLATSKRAQQFIGWTVGLFLFSIFAQLQVKGGKDFTFIIKPINVFLFFFSSYFICRLVRYTYGYVTIEIILYYIVISGVIQSLVSGLFFLRPDTYDVYVSYLNERQGGADARQLANIGRRFIGIGNRYVDGATRLGFAFLSLLILPYLGSNKFTNHKTLYWFCFIIIALGGIFTARTFFVIMGIGFLLLFLIEVKSILQFIKFNFRIILRGIIIVFSIYLLITLFVNPQIIKVTLNWAFEIFINFFNGQGLQSSSTEHLKTMYRFPENFKTWLMGDALFRNPDGSYYMKTDVGYLRMLFYFGSLGTLYFIIMLLGYYNVLKRLTYQKPLKYFFGALVLATLILNIKAMSFFSEYFVLFLIFLIFSDTKKDPYNPIIT